jgi:L-sorbose 1-phosphate reductase
MMSKGLDPAGLVTHIGGLDAVAEATNHLPEIPGGKKLIYTHIQFPLTAIADFEEKGKNDPILKKLADICKTNNGLWSIEAESYLLANYAKQ